MKVLGGRINEEAMNEGAEMDDSDAEDSGSDDEMEGETGEASDEQTDGDTSESSDGECESGTHAAGDYKGPKTAAMYADGPTAVANGTAFRRRTSKRRSSGDTQPGSSAKASALDDDMTFSIHPGRGSQYRVPLSPPVPSTSLGQSLHAIGAKVFGTQ